MAQTEIVSQSAYVLGTFIVVVLLGTGGVVLAESVIGARTDRRKREVRETAASWFETRRRADEPAWETAVSELTRAERNALVEILRETLRDHANPQHTGMWQLAEILGVAPDLETIPRRRGARLRELDWAALLGYDADPAVVMRYVFENRIERETAARVLLPSSDPAASATATKLVLGHGPVSVWGLDMVYRQHRADASILLEVVAEISDSMSEMELAHALVVAGQCNTPADRWVEWTTRQLDSDSDCVRIAAASALADWETTGEGASRPDRDRARAQGRQPLAIEPAQRRGVNSQGFDTGIWHTRYSDSLVGDDG